MENITSSRNGILIDIMACIVFCIFIYNVIMSNNPKQFLFFQHYKNNQLDRDEILLFMEDIEKKLINEITDYNIRPTQNITQYKLQKIYNELMQQLPQSDKKIKLYTYPILLLQSICKLNNNIDLFAIYKKKYPNNDYNKMLSFWPKMIENVSNEYWNACSYLDDFANQKLNDLEYKLMNIREKYNDIYSDDTIIYSEQKKAFDETIQIILSYITPKYLKT